MAKAKPNPPQRTGVARNCEERVPAEFEICWNCGSTNDGEHSVQLRPASTDNDSLSIGRDNAETPSEKSISIFSKVFIFIGVCSLSTGAFWLAERGWILYRYPNTTLGVVATDDDRHDVTFSRLPRPYRALTSSSVNYQYVVDDRSYYVNVPVGQTSSWFATVRYANADPAVAVVEEAFGSLIAIAIAIVLGIAIWTIGWQFR